MPKMKTSRAAAKRFKKTGGGHFRRFKANKSHILTKKKSKRKRHLRQGGRVAKADEARVKRMLGG